MIFSQFVLKNFQESILHIRNDSFETFLIAFVIIFRLLPMKFSDIIKETWK